MLQLLNDQIAVLLESKLEGLLAIYQFGSFGTAYERPDSDIDLAVLAKQALEPILLWNLAQEVSAELHQDVDLLDLRSVSTVMRAQVIAYGQRLYCKDTLTCDLFEVMAYSSYARLNESRRDILEDIQTRGSVYG
jgi:uncharacterized protein